MVVTRTKATKSGATKKVKGVRQEFRHVFNKASKATIAYKDYFSPDSDAEKKLLGLKDIVCVTLFSFYIVGSYLFF